MAYFELTLPLDHEWMPDEGFPFATRFFLGPKNHPEKGIVIGSETGTSITLPAEFAECRKTRRLHEVPVAELFLRSTAIVDIPKRNREAITEQDLRSALANAELESGDAILIRTGWGNGEMYRSPGGKYVWESPHLAPGAGELLASAVKQKGSNLVLTDMAVIGWPDKHLIPEWCSFQPMPACYPSPEGRMYVHLYTPEKARADFAVERALAEAGIMTVKRLIRCGDITHKKVKIIVSPLHIVRGVASTCRVIAVQED